MSQHERKAHIRNLDSGEVTDVSKAVVNRANARQTIQSLQPVQKKNIDAALETLANLAGEADIEITLDNQIMILEGAKKNIIDEIDSSPKVGFRADLEGVANKKEFLADLESKIEELQKKSLKETEEALREAATKMSSFHRTGFTSQRSEAEALMSYVEELADRLGTLKSKYEGQ